MRIAIVNWSRRKVGGTEAYLDSVIPELLNVGHQVGFWHESDVPLASEPITLPKKVPRWCVSELGREVAIKVLREWKPDVIYAHSLMEPDLEAEMLKVAPAVFFAHAYYGTCISGAKTFKFPTVTPCHRRFGWQCLAHYYPHRCGGLSPLTMLKEYKRQLRRLEHLSIYKAIVTHSSYMREEYIKHGFEPDRVHCLSYYARGIESHEEDSSLDHLPVVSLSQSKDAFRAKSAPHISTSLRLLFLGRMDFLKGGRVLIDALPKVCAALNRPLRVTFAGEGPERAAWERQAARVQKQVSGLEIEFIGWVKGQRRETIWNNCHLLVLSSVWPEPFGLVGPEAGLRSVPTVAFAIGGITDWLIDGVNGFLASGDPPTSENLATAIMKCFRDPAQYARLRRGALEVARQFKMRRHLKSLLKVLEGVAGESSC
jgi:glycosyltransferase involved in cell wall biosynthesis